MSEYDTCVSVVQEKDVLLEASDKEKCRFVVVTQFDCWRKDVSFRTADHKQLDLNAGHVAPYQFTAKNGDKIKFTFVTIDLKAGPFKAVYRRAKSDEPNPIMESIKTIEYKVADLKKDIVYVFWAKNKTPAYFKNHDLLAEVKTQVNKKIVEHKALPKTAVRSAPLKTTPAGK
ncbi:hypothetical protein DLAC_04981 [Tieghemostelium lacteum]|uniref:Uncharacterized protein n=1 Tax=Tieghemostelium lacteum TaxID=361077 RepID=A0A151ZI63_TIELA|nr:hypothetical protein DLAC_04981 [Tieghemostelium lacteum]|eukprot:KYQ93607.1 hypothetical protein DLAC_04981 [Tieghemostelium lacteum]